MSRLALLLALQVAHGTPAAPGSFPAVVALVDLGTPGAGFMGSRLEGVFCTGTLIAPRVVLTAAHCIADWETHVPRADLASRVSVYVGAGRLNFKGSVRGQTRVLRAVVHPEADLALLLLATEPPAVTPVPRAAQAPVLGATLRSVGFGERDPGGRRNTMGLKSAAVRAAQVHTPSSFCSLRDGVRTPASGGDSGGPALIELGDGGVAVAGVLSNGVTLEVADAEVEADCWVDLGAFAPWLDTSLAALLGDDP